MRFSQYRLLSTGISTGLLLMVLPACSAARPRGGHAHAVLSHASGHSRRPALHVATATHRMLAMSMPADRATEIQSALIKQGYLTGEPSGVWDGQTISAMEKLQADSGWQSKVTPDSRALIKLGLGPQATPQP